MRDSRLFDSVVSYASDLDDSTHAEGLRQNSEDPWRLEDLESDEQRPDSRLGQTLGTIRLEGIVGKGGMGTVFEGWDEKLERKVAVKAISHRYRDHSEARQRFLREARLLSKLQHPNICQIHDHMEGEDGDYLVLELVDGRSLRSLREEGETFTQAEGLRIARQLAAALVAAHDRGVAHRDLKPANIMVTPGGTVKLLDIGLGLSVERAVVKESADAGLQWTESGAIRRLDLSDLPATSDELADSVTVVGGRRDTRSFQSAGSSGSIEGTLAYMSPEQARSQEAGTASDIYSLGLVLQEVFTGRGAYPPDLPATNQLVRAGQGDTLPVSGIDSDLARLIERMKSVAPGSRPSAPDVADRLRWIAGKPARRLRSLALGAFFAMLVAFSAVMAYQRSRIAEEAARANGEAESARQVTEYLKGVFEVANPWNSSAADVSARELLSGGTEKIRTELQDQPLIRARLLTTMGEVTRRLGDYEGARPLLDESLALQKSLDAQPRDLASTMVSIALLESNLGHYDLAAAGLRDAIAIQRRHLDPLDPDLAHAVLQLGCTEHFRGDLKAAFPLYTEALDLYETTTGPDSLETAEVVSQLALVYTAEGQNAKAEEMHLRALGIRESLLPPTHPDLGISYNNLAAFYYGKGQFRKAVPLFLKDVEISEASLGRDHPDLAYGHKNLGSTLLQLGRFDQAETHVRRALEIRRSANQDDHDGIASATSSLATIYLARGQSEEALELFAEANRVQREIHPAEHPRIASSLSSLAEAYSILRRHDEAALRLREALEIRIAHFGAEHFQTARSRASLGKVLLGGGHLEEAGRYLRQAKDVAEEHLEQSPDDRMGGQVLAEAEAGLAFIHSRRNLPGEAQQLYAAARSRLSVLARDSEAYRFDLSLVEVLVAMGRTEEAEPIARGLLDLGLRRQDFVDLCREQGWLE